MFQKHKKILFVILLVILIAVVAVKVIAGNMESNLEALKSAEITPVDLELTEDGTYFGSYSVLPISVEVNVTIKDHAISNIELIKHTNGQGKPAEAILETVLEAQTLQVDSVSGATYSSKVILMAIENALIESQK